MQTFIVSVLLVVSAFTSRKALLWWDSPYSNNSTLWKEWLEPLDKYPHHGMEISFQLYNVAKNGSFVYFTTNKEPNYGYWSELQTVEFLKSKGLKQVPLIMCQGYESISAMLQINNGNDFIQDSLEKAKKLGLNGYNFDCEMSAPSNAINNNQMTNFIKRWADALHNENMVLSTDIPAPDAYQNYLTESCQQWYQLPSDDIATGDTFNLENIEEMELRFKINIDQCMKEKYMPGFEPFPWTKGYWIQVLQLVEKYNIDRIASWRCNPQIYDFWYPTLNKWLDGEIGEIKQFKQE